MWLYVHLYVMQIKYDVLRVNSVLLSICRQNVMLHMRGKVGIPDERQNFEKAKGRQRKFSPQTQLGGELKRWQETKYSQLTEPETQYKKPQTTAKHEQMNRNKSGSWEGREWGGWEGELQK